MRLIAGSILILASAVFVIAGVLASGKPVLVTACITCALLMLLSGVWQLNKGIVNDDNEHRMRLEQHLQKPGQNRDSGE